MGQIKFIGSLLMVAIFSLSIMIFAMNFASDNDSTVSLADVNGFSAAINQTQDNLSQWHTEVINSSESFYESQISEGDTATSGGMFKLGPSTVLTATLTLMTAAFNAVFSNEFGWVFTAVAGFLGFVLVLLIWKTWGGRNPE